MPFPRRLRPWGRLVSERVSVVYIPLAHDTKVPTQKGWNLDEYEGVDAAIGGTALRLDGLYVVDCDTPEMVATWRSTPGTETPYVVETVRGAHFYYRAPEGARSRIGVVPGQLDVKSGRGAYARVYRLDAPNPDDLPLAPVEVVNTFAPAKTVSDEPGWDMIPDGQRNSTLTTVAGAMRKQGAGVEAIAATLATMNTHRCDPPLPDEEVATIVNSVMRYEPDPDIPIVLVEDPPETKLGIRWAADLEERPPPEWLWDPYFPQGRFVLLDGSEGIGKSMFSAALATMVAGNFGLSTRSDGVVLWLPAEDDPEEDLLRRLRAAGYDRNRHHPIGFADPTKFTAAEPDDISALEAEIEATGANLVILDPVRSFLKAPGAKNYSNNDDAHVRPPLEALSRLAHRSGCTIVGIHHWRKNVSEGVKAAATGSAGFSQVARHRISMAWVGTTDDGEGAFAVTKSNIAPTGQVTGYKIEMRDDSPCFVVGDRTGDRDLDAWLKRVGKQYAGEGETAMPPMDLSSEFVEMYGIEPGTKITRKLVREYMGDNYRIMDADATFDAIGELSAANQNGFQIRKSAGQSGQAAFYSGIGELADWRPTPIE